jgi:hypothetical protein
MFQCFWAREIIVGNSQPACHVASDEVAITDGRSESTSLAFDCWPCQYPPMSEPNESNLMRTVISASRRTDIPAHYYDWLREGLRRGEVEVTNPFNQKVITISLRDEDVHTSVLWSKDFSRVVRDLDFWRPRRLYFNFTLNDCEYLEPHVPPLGQRIVQMQILAEAFGPERINWRFDPVVFWDDGRRDNMGGFAAARFRL